MMLYYTVLLNILVVTLRVIPQPAGMLKEFLFGIALTALVFSYGAQADDEYSAPLESEPSLELQTRRSRRRLPTSKKHALLSMLIYDFHNTDFCIKYLYVMVQTSASEFAGTLGEHQVVLKANGIARAVNLTTTVGGIVPGKGDLWKLSLEYDFGFNGCITVKKIENMALQENDMDGWKIDSIVTFLVVNPFYWEMSSVDLNVNTWIDGDLPFTKQFILTLHV